MKREVEGLYSSDMGCWSWDIVGETICQRMLNISRWVAGIDISHFLNNHTSHDRIGLGFSENLFFFFFFFSPPSFSISLFPKFHQSSKKRRTCCIIFCIQKCCLLLFSLELIVLPLFSTVVPPNMYVSVLLSLL